MKTIRLLLLSAALLGAGPVSLLAQTSQVPTSISYQGVVTDLAGVPLGNTSPINRNIIFRLWDSPTASANANLKYSEQQLTTIFKGEFSVLVGVGNAVTSTFLGFSESPKGPPTVSISNVFDGSARFLGVAVDNGAGVFTEITPRQQIVSSAFTFRAKLAESLAANAVTSAAITDATVTLSKLAPNSVDASKIADLSVGNNELANGAVSSTKLATNAVTSGAIVDGTITSDDILDGTISSNDILNGTIVAADIADTAISLGKMASSSVDSSKIVDGSIDTADLGDLKVTEAKLADNSVTSAKIVDATIGTADLSNGAVTADKLASIVRAGSGNTGGFTFKAGGDADGGLYSTAEGSIELRTNGSPRMTLTGGRVGIGISPTKAILQIFDGASNTIVAHKFLALDSFGGVGNGTAGAFTASLHADKEIHAAVFRAFSDARIKNIAGRSNAAKDLEKLLALEVTDYTYRDTITRGSAPQKKLVAQQVETVYPQAVLRSTDEVPDIYQKATIKDGWVTLATDLKVGDRVRLIAEGAEGVHEVLEVRDGAFRTDFNPAGRDVFVFGRQVSDFRSVDYEAIAMLNVSATQELHRQLEAKDADITALRQRVAELEAKDQARESRLAAIEAVLAGTDDRKATVTTKNRSPRATAATR